jgi:hypothetical protein
MRAYLFALVGAFVLTLSGDLAFAQNIELGPGGVRIYRHHHYGYGADCHALRQACLRKGELGEEGRGNCQRYRETCR